MFESNAILRYVAENNPVAAAFYPTDDATLCAIIDQCLDWKDGVLMKTARVFAMPVYANTSYAGTAAQFDALKSSVLDLYAHFVKVFLGGASKELHGETFYVGGSASPNVADLAVVPLFVLLHGSGAPLPKALVEYVRRVRAAVPELDDLLRDAEGGRSIDRAIAAFKRRQVRLNNKLTVWADPVSSVNAALLLLLNEAGVPHAHESLSLIKGEHKTKKFAEINPLQQTPAAKTVDGVKLAESAAIARYVCRFYASASRFYPSDRARRALVDMALDWRSSALGAPIFKLAGHGMGFPSAEPSKAERQAAVRELRAALRTLDERFLGNGKFDFVGGDRVTIADFFIALQFKLLEVVDEEVFTLPASTVAYLERFYAAVSVEAQQAVLVNGIDAHIDERLRHAAEQKAKQEAKEAKELAKSKRNAQKKAASQQKHSGDGSDSARHESDGNGGGGGSHNDVAASDGGVDASAPAAGVTSTAKSGHESRFSPLKKFGSTLKRKKTKEKSGDGVAATPAAAAATDAAGGKKEVSDESSEETAAVEAESGAAAAAAAAAAPTEGAGKGSGGGAAKKSGKKSKPAVPLKDVDLSGKKIEETVEKVLESAKNAGQAAKRRVSKSGKKK